MTSGLADWYILQTNCVCSENDPQCVTTSRRPLAQGQRDFSKGHEIVGLIAQRCRIGQKVPTARKDLMLDSFARKLIDPPLNRAGRMIAAKGLTADGVTLIGLALGLIAALLVAFGVTGLAVVPLLASRIADGLDGAVARATTKTDFGGYLDIASDFLFYGAIPFAFVVMDPAANGVAGAFLLLSFYVNGTSFLGYAILAEKHGDTTSAQGQKSLYYSNGILEGTETIVFFVILCLFPSYFAALAWVFGLLCFATATLRIWGAYQTYKGPIQ